MPLKLIKKITVIVQVFKHVLAKQVNCDLHKRIYLICKIRFYDLKTFIKP